MPTPLVTERWTTQTFSRGKSARRQFDISGATDIANAQSLLSSLADVQEGKPHYLDPTITVPVGGIEMSVNGRMYVASVAYSGAAGGGGFEATAVDSLLEQKWRVTAEPVMTEEPVEAEIVGDHIPIVNSSRQPFATQLTRPFPSVDITMWRWEYEWLLSRHLAYANRWNSDAILLPKVGVAQPGEALVEYIKLKEEIAADADIVAVVYKIKCRPLITINNDPDGTETVHGFYKRLLDIGMEANSSSGLKPITWKIGVDAKKPIKQPVRLDGYGLPFDTTAFDVSGASGTALTKLTKIDKTDNGVFLMFDPTRGSIAFSGLNIGANL